MSPRDHFFFVHMYIFVKPKSKSQNPGPKNPPRPTHDFIHYPSTHILCLHPPPYFYNAMDSGSDSFYPIDCRPRTELLSVLEEKEKGSVYIFILLYLPSHWYPFLIV